MSASCSAAAQLQLAQLAAQDAAQDARQLHPAEFLIVRHGHTQATCGCTTTHNVLSYAYTPASKSHSRVLLHAQATTWLITNYLGMQDDVDGLMTFVVAAICLVAILYFVQTTRGIVILCAHCTIAFSNYYMRARVESKQNKFCFLVAGASASAFKRASGARASGTKGANPRNAPWTLTGARWAYSGRCSRSAFRTHFQFYAARSRPSPTNVRQHTMAFVCKEHTN